MIKPNPFLSNCSWVKRIAVKLVLASAFLFTSASLSFADGDIFDGYIQIGGTWYNIGGVNDGRNNPAGSANAAFRTLLNNASFGTQTFGSFNITGFQNYGWTNFSSGVSGGGANYRIWRNGESEPSTWTNFWNDTTVNYYSGGDYEFSVTGQSVAIIGATFINGDTYNIKIQSYVDQTGVGAGSKFYERTGNFTVNGARQLYNSSSSANQAAVYNTSSSGGVVKQGSGTLTLIFDNSNASTGQKGEIYIDEGTVAVNPNSGITGDQALGGNSTVVRLGATGGSTTSTFSLTDTDGGLDISRQVVVRAGSSGTKTISSTNTSGSNTFSGAITLDDAVTIVGSAGGVFNLAGRFEDGIGVGNFGVLFSSGTTQLSGSQSNTGITLYTVGGGTLQLNKSNTFDAIQSTLTINAGGTVEYLASNQLGDSATINNAGTLNTGSGFTDTVSTLSSNGTLSGTGTITATTYNLSGGTVSANLGAGTLNVAGNTNLNGTSAAGTVSVSNGAALNLGSGFNRLTNAANITLALNSSLTIASDQTVAWVREAGENNGGSILVGSGATLTINGANFGQSFQNSISGSGNLVFSGTGNSTLTLYGTQNRTGTTTVTSGSLATVSSMSSSAFVVAGGNFSTGGSSQIDSGASITVNSGTFALGGNDTVGAISGLGGTINIGSNRLTTNVTGSSTFSGAISGVVGGQFEKSGAGTLILAGANTYSGTTSVSQGTLRVNGSLGNTAVTVASGATLGGNGTIGGLVTLNSGATLAPGSGVGILTLGNGLTLSSGGNVTMEITSGTTFDKVNATAGNITYGGVLYISLGGFTPAYNSTFDLFDGTRSGVTQFSSILFSDSFDGTGSTFNYDTGTLTVIPEPSTYALMGIGAAFVLWRLRRRKQG